MCGIFGVTGLNGNALDKAHKALHTLTHRGPDGWDFIHENEVYLGHRRLSILDLSENGKQPMIKDGVYLTVNGEIYNFKVLNNILSEKHGVKFKSGSDSETVLHGYIHWGIEELLNKIEGMFALSIYDSNSGEIHVARDHAGIKPLYYSLQNEGFSWGSELKALESFYGKKNLSVDYTAIYDFMSYLHVPSPKSLYQNIFKLEPAHFATYNTKDGSFNKKRYWKLPINRHITDVEEAKLLIQNAIEGEVASHLVSDVPVGTFLSGGVDSSIVSYEVSKLVASLTTCSIGFDDARVDESRFASLVAKRIGSKHVAQNMDHNAVNDNFKLLKDMYDEPFGDTSAFPAYAVSKLASEKMTVVLTGDGADEIFGGYTPYKKWYMALTPWLGFLAPIRPIITYLKNKKWGAVSRLARGVEVFAIWDPLERKQRLGGAFLKTDTFKKEFRTKHNIPEDYDELWYLKQYYRPELPLKSRYMYLDFHTTMTDGILCKVDRTSMACSIETRVPFLSKRVIEAAWAIDENVLFLDGELKGLLKSMYAKKLPTECLYRRKQGFSLGGTQKGDKLHLNGKPLPLKILSELYSEEIL